MSYRRFAPQPYYGDGPAKQGYGPVNEAAPQQSASSSSSGTVALVALAALLLVGVFVAAILAAVWSHSSAQDADTIEKRLRVHGVADGISEAQYNEERKLDDVARQIDDLRIALTRSGPYASKAHYVEYYDLSSFGLNSPLGLTHNDDPISLERTRIVGEFAKIDESLVDPTKYGKMRAALGHGAWHYGTEPDICATYEKFARALDAAFTTVVFAYYLDTNRGNPTAPIGVDTMILESEEDIERMLRFMEAEARLLERALEVDWIGQVAALGAANGFAVFPISNAFGAYSALLDQQYFFAEDFFFDLYVLQTRGITLNSHQQARLAAALAAIRTASGQYANAILTLNIDFSSTFFDYWAVNGLVDTCVPGRLHNGVIADPLGLFHRLVDEHARSRARIDELYSVALPDWQGPANWWKHASDNGYAVTKLYRPASDCVPDPETGISPMLSDAFDSLRRIQERAHRIYHVGALHSPQVILNFGGSCSSDFRGSYVEVTPVLGDFERGGYTHLKVYEIASRYLSDSIILHEYTHALANMHDLADGSPTERVRRLFGSPFPSNILFGAHSEGHASFTERIIALEQEIFDASNVRQLADMEASYMSFQLEDTIPRLGIAVGVWTPEQAAQWQLDNSILVGAYATTVGDIVPLLEQRAQMPLGGGIDAYINGYDEWKRALERARAACGHERVNLVDFWDQSISPIYMADIHTKMRQIDAYIANGCVKLTSQWGDTDRSVSVDALP